MAVADPVDPLENLDHAVSCVRLAADEEARKLLVRELLRGSLDYASPEGKAIGARRALLCTRLREADLWPAR